MMWGYGYDGWAWMWVVGSLFVIGVVVLVVVLGVIAGLAMITTGHRLLHAAATFRKSE